MMNLKKLKNRIDWFCENKINVFSPTISPASKSFQCNEIESIFEGIRYFFENGVTETVVQRKYKGSYCDIYLQKNLDNTYFVSGNGYMLSHINLDEAKQACRDLHSRFDWTDMHLQTVIIQSEMMPWSTSGKELIDNEFLGYLNTHKNHYNYLSQSGLYTKIDAARQSESYRQYMDYKANHSEKEIKEHFPSHIVRQYESLTAFKVLNLLDYMKYIDIYKEQIEHFGKSSDIYFKPFNILKKVFDDGSELLVNDNMSYGEVNDDEFLNLPTGNEERMNR